ncbi:MAG: hypothetical protein KJP07_04150 [Desulfatitalea sp.]|nr:hypothetical protein [Desulfatitalea sp.]
MITIMHANNEVDPVQPIAVIAAIINRYGIVMHTDATVPRLNLAVL